MPAQRKKHMSRPIGYRRYCQVPRMTAPPLSVAIDRIYAEHVNPQWVRLLDLLRMNEHYVWSGGTELLTDDDRRILDFLSGYCVLNAGHNHPAITAAVREELDRSSPSML